MFEYLLVDMCILLPPFIVQRLNHKYRLIALSQALVPIAIPSLLFLFWDFFAVNTLWYFNNTYILGIVLGGIPVEEIFFFFVASYSCLYFWCHMSQTKVVTISSFFRLVLASVLCVGYVLVYLFFSTRLYTSIVLYILISTYVLQLTQKSVFFLTKKYLLFLIFLSIVITIFNGYLTARPIVRYNPSGITRLHVGTIPIEDYIYGVALLNLVLFIYEKYGHRHHTQ